MFLALATLFFGLYVANVFMGALLDAAFIGDVAEMVMLLIASFFFTAAILKREANAKQENHHEP